MLSRSLHDYIFINAMVFCSKTRLSPVHTVTENCDCRRRVRLSQKTATVALFGGVDRLLGSDHLRFQQLPDILLILTSETLLCTWTWSTLLWHPPNIKPAQCMSRSVCISVSPVSWKTDSRRNFKFYFLKLFCMNNWTIVWVY